jgi:MAPEG family
MSVSAGPVYLASLALLFLKYVGTIVIQARERMRLRRFRYPEDAACWAGRVAEDSDLCQRAQNLLRNDCENQPFYLAFGAAYVAQGLGPEGALFYFGGYGLSRLCHGYFMLRARQPHRNRAFAMGLIILAMLAVHVVYASIASLESGPFHG